MNLSRTDDSFEYFLARLYVHLNLSFNKDIEWFDLFKQDLHFEIMWFILWQSLIFGLLHLHLSNSDKFSPHLSSELINNLLVSANLILCLIIFSFSLRLFGPLSYVLPVFILVSVIANENVKYLLEVSGIAEISFPKYEAIFLSNNLKSYPDPLWIPTKISFYLVYIKLHVEWAAPLYSPV